MHTVADPDLQIRGGGGWGGVVSKKNFQPFGSQSGLKVRGGGRSPRAQAPPLDPPLAHFVQ